ncbi:Hypothetical_protein [Hexamita inflata]|uniref:Hypothetical_protein n=1 Tax=Hexamita inflata TaxID=28002 RepID=A0AA86PB05_9EUKA|nr:Hypothetical protein HINF_LOCUS23052 [Hexamita inflata]
MSPVIQARLAPAPTLSFTFTHISTFQAEIQTASRTELISEPLVWLLQMQPEMLQLESESEVVLLSKINPPTSFPPSLNWIKLASIQSWFQPLKTSPETLSPCAQNVKTEDVESKSQSRQMRAPWARCQGNFTASCEFLTEIQEESPKRAKEGRSECQIERFNFTSWVLVVYILQYIGLSNALIICVFALTEDKSACFSQKVIICLLISIFWLQTEPKFKEYAYVGTSCLKILWWKNALDFKIPRINIKRCGVELTNITVLFSLVLHIINIQNKYLI